MMDGANARTDLHYHPVAYVSTNRSSATGTFSNFCTKVSASTGQIASFDAKAAVKKVRFAWNDSFAGWNWSASTDFGTGAVTLTASRPFASSPKVYYNEAAELAWEVGFGEQGTQDDDLSWHRSSSHHELHLTYKARRSSFETVFYLSCLNASGCSFDSTVTEGVWRTFTGRKACRKDGNKLKYYGAYNTKIITLRSLLIKCDGQCGAWAEMFETMLDVQGVSYARNQLVPIPELYADGFLVKEWSFIGSGTSGDANFPYKNDRPINGHSVANHILGNDYDWGQVAEVRYISGMPGQNNPKPAAWFERHFVVKASGLLSESFYDPSYGVKYNDHTDFDDKLSGFWKDSDDRMSFWLKENPSGTQIGTGRSAFVSDL